MSVDRHGPLAGGTKRADTDETGTGRTFMIDETTAGAEGGRHFSHTPPPPATTRTALSALHQCKRVLSLSWPSLLGGMRAPRRPQHRTAAHPGQLGAGVIQDPRLRPPAFEPERSHRLNPARIPSAA